MNDQGFRRGLEDDGQYLPEIGEQSLTKIRLHNAYISMFTTAMRSKWPQLAYLGLYSGAGRARLRETGEIVETSALGSLRVQHPFTKHIFVDSDDRCVRALQARVNALEGKRDVTILQADVLEALPRVVEAMPSYSATHGLLSFCFVDPFSADLDFRIFRELGGRYRMDFLVLLMLGLDARTNFRRYYQDPDDTRIARLVDDENWRQEWRERGLSKGNRIHFLLEKFDQAMAGIGYQTQRPSEAHPVRVMGKSVFLYSLVLYSKSELGQKFWRATRQGTSGQGSFELDL